MHAVFVYLTSPAGIAIEAAALAFVASELKGFGKGGAWLQPVVDLIGKWAVGKASPEALSVMREILKIESEVTGKAFVLPGDAAPAPAPAVAPQA